jgi:hypothetical protein
MGVIDEGIKRLIIEAHMLEIEKDNLALRTKEINKRLDAIAMEAQASFSMDDDPELIMQGIGRVQITVEPCFNINAANKQTLIERFKLDETTSAMVREEIHPSTLKAYLREAIRETGELPHSDLIDQYNKPIIKFRKG